MNILHKLKELFSPSTTQSSISAFDGYIAVCRDASANDEVFSTFKQNPVYNHILEHTTFEQGLSYIQMIKRDNPFLLDDELMKKFKTNDTYGNPLQFNYEGIGNISPSTLRYIKVLSDLIKHFGKLDKLKIVEIGTGYGGQCKIIHDLFTPSQYLMFDLPEVMQLNKKYLSKFQLTEIQYLNLDTLHETVSSDLLISNYAFTECNRNIQQIYLDKVIRRSKMAYITCNFISDYYKINSFSKEELLKMHPHSKVFPEEPLTSEKNFILIWK